MRDLFRDDPTRATRYLIEAAGLTLDFSRNRLTDDTLSALADLARACNIPADQLAETTMDPRRRTLRRLTIDDAEGATEVFDLLMGSDVAPRKEFIVVNGGHMSEEDLDI